MAAGKIQIKTLVLCLAAVVGVEAGVRLGIPGDVSHTLTFLGAGRLLQAGLIIAILFLAENGPASVGLSVKGLVPGLKRGCIWAAGFGLLVLVGGLLSWALGINPLALIRSPLPADSGHILLFFLVGGIIAPVMEEIFFRGVLYGFFRRWGAVTAVLLSTLAFVVAHPMSSAIPITQIVGGLLFAVAYEVEKNLMAPITLHCLGNMAIFALSLIA